MTTAELIAQARANRTETRHMDADATHKALLTVLEILLEGIDYEERKAALPGLLARSIATIVANIEDTAITSAGVQ